MEEGSKLKRHRGIESDTGKKEKKDKGATFILEEDINETSRKKKESQRAYAKKAYEKTKKESSVKGSKEKNILQ